LWAASGRGTVIAAGRSTRSLAMTQDRSPQAFPTPWLVASPVVLYAALGIAILLGNGGLSDDTPRSIAFKALAVLIALASAASFAAVLAGIVVLLSRPELRSASNTVQLAFGALPFAMVAALYVCCTVIMV
jgi:hypothetical protein